MIFGRALVFQNKQLGGPAAIGAPEVIVRIPAVELAESDFLEEKLKIFGRHSVEQASVFIAPGRGVDHRSCQRRRDEQAPALFQDAPDVVHAIFAESSLTAAASL
jgi:hypothetical protein